jgi:DNA polymerase-3 subunit beta
MEISENTLMSALTDLACFLDCGLCNKLMTGYFFDGTKERVVALDGHRIGIKNIKETFLDKNFKFVIPGEVCSHLKKIINSKHDGIISVFTDNKYVMLVGKDFVYWSRLIEGEYYKVDQMIDMSYDFEFEIDAAELGSYAKEYKKAASSEDKTPMFFTYEKDKNVFQTGIVTHSYMTTDTISGYENKASGLTKDFLYGFNPLYVMDAMSLFKDEVTCKGMYSMRAGHQISPIVFCDDTYTALVLPVNVSEENVIAFKDYIAA